MSERKESVIKRLAPRQSDGNGNHEESGRAPENHAFSRPLMPIGADFPSIETIFGTNNLGSETTNPVETIKPVVYLSGVINESGESAVYYDNEREPQNLELPYNIEPGTVILTQNPKEIFGPNTTDKILVLGQIVIEHQTRKTKTAHLLVTSRLNATLFEEKHGAKVDPKARVVKLEDILKENPKAEGQTLSREQIEEIHSAQKLEKFKTTLSFKSV